MKIAKGLWSRFLIVIPLVLVLSIVSWRYIRSVSGTYEAEGSLDISHKGYEVADVSLSTAGVVDVQSLTIADDGSARVVFTAVSDGKVQASLGAAGAQDSWSLEVRDGAIIESGVDFSGWQVIYLSVCVLLAVVVVLFAQLLIRLWRSSWYGYEMVACGGGLLFCLFQLSLFALLAAHGFVDDFSSFVVELTSMSSWFITTTLVPIAGFALLVSASNIVLIRREGLRPVNLLGIAVSLFWAGACAVWYWMPQVVFAITKVYALANVLDSLVSCAISFGECLLFSTILCAWLASRHVPRHGADYLVMLGCGIRADGTPSPLLAGRVDRAFEFDAARSALGDAPATFVPSGGKGGDEIISEAQSMANYLMSKGVAPGRIVCEDRSATTRQNMTFSREVIEAHAGCDASELAVVFSTTNYHVFRGYVCAHEAGMAVEGLGSQTRAYFWPNAFLREFAGLLVAQWKAILQLYLVLAVIYGFAAYVAATL